MSQYNSAFTNKSNQFFENEFTRMLSSLRPFDDSGRLDLSTKEKSYGLCVLLNIARETWNNLLKEISSTIESEKKRLVELEALFEIIKSFKGGVR